MYFATFKTTSVIESTEHAEVKKWAMKFSAPESELDSGDNLKEMFEHIKGNGIKEVYFHDLDFAGNFLVKWLMKNDYQFVDILDKEHEIEPNQWKYMCNERGSIYVIVVCLSNGLEVKFIDSWKSLTVSYEDLKKAAHIEEDFSGDFVFEDFNEDKQNRLILKDMEKNIDSVIKAYVKVLYIYKKRLTKSSMAIADFKKFYNKENNNKRQYSVDFGDKVFEYGTEKFVPHNVLTAEEWNFVHKSHAGGYNNWKKGIENKLLNVPNGVIYDANAMHASIAWAEAVPYGRLLTVKPLSGEYATLVTVIIERADKKDPKAPNLIRAQKGKYKMSEYVDHIENEERVYWLEEWEFILKHYKAKYFILKERYFRRKKAFHNWLDEKRELKLNARDKVELVLHKDVPNGFIGKLAQSIRLASRVIVKDGRQVMTVAKDMNFENYKHETTFAPKGSKVLVDCDTGVLIKLLNNNEQRYGKQGEYRHETHYSEVAQRNHVGTSSWIYMRARIKLWTVIFDNLPLWLYSDSDSCMFTGTPKNIPIHANKYGYWKAQNKFDILKVLRGKAYMFRSTEYWKDGRWIKNNELVKKISGLNKSGKDSLDFTNFNIGHVVKDGKDAILNVEGGKIRYKVDFTLGSEVFL